MSAFPNTRTLQDTNLQVTVALPAAGANVTSSSIDTACNPDRVPEIEALISVPVTPALVDAKTLTVTLYDSADNVTFAAVAQLPAFAVTASGGAGGAAISQQFKIPLGTRRYIAINCAITASGGDSTAVKATLGLVF